LERSTAALRRILKIGLLTDALDRLTLIEALDWCAERDIAAVELGVGGYSGTPHADLTLLGDAAGRDRLLGLLAERELELAALNVSGNPLHPDRAIGARHDTDLRAALQLAHTLGVPRVVAMSGCPGGPGGGAWPVFAGGAWLPDMEGLWDWQWTHIASYWRELSQFAGANAPDVVVCLELHPGTSIYNAESYRQLRNVSGENVRVNLDPSHFWWQGIDPVTTVRELGDAVAFVHGKDTLLHPDRIARDGVLDFRWPADADTMPWHFAAVGAGRPLEEWEHLLRALNQAGYDDVVSIEHEDPNLDAEAGIEASLRGLQSALALLGVGERVN
jgi:sugar phosphate isomerase/epimerase